MAKPPRSPLLGYNHNLTHLGRVFHIQTEDSGPVTPRLFTHLFYEGTILVSRKHEYDATLPDDKVRALMQEQHKTVMKDLMRARLDGMIIPFFAARGDDLAPVQGAVPSAALSETPGPVMVLPPEPIADVAPASGEQVAPKDLSAGAPASRAPATPAAAGSRRTSTRSFEPVGQRGPTPTPVVVRAPDARRSPFVRNAAPASSRISSADGVVVQRNVVVGGGSNASGRPARIRPPVPYVVTGGGHTERPPRAGQSGPGAASSGQTAAGAPPQQTTTAVASSTAVVITPSSLAPLVGNDPLLSQNIPRTTTPFGVGLADDKSLDEVILEYLAEDGEST